QDLRHHLRRLRHHGHRLAGLRRRLLHGDRRRPEQVRSGVRQRRHPHPVAVPERLLSSARFAAPATPAPHLARASSFWRASLVPIRCTAAPGARGGLLTWRGGGFQVRRCFPGPGAANGPRVEAPPSPVPACAPSRCLPARLLLCRQPGSWVSFALRFHGHSRSRELSPRGPGGRRSMLNMRSAFLALAVVSFGAWAQEGTTAPAAPPAEAPAEAKPAAPATPAADTAKPKKPGEEEYVEEIVVTGSRIPRVELTTAAPVTVLNRTQIESSGRPSIGDILQSIPEQSNAINTQFNNGGDGSTRINLRGLGTARTLVLVNGRRFVAGGTGADASVDLNSIPTSAIQRIEILKDGASAVYGSDAISGVVNIITRKDFSG